MILIKSSYDIFSDTHFFALLENRVNCASFDATVTHDMSHLSWLWRVSKLLKLLSGSEKSSYVPLLNQIFKEALTLQLAIKRASRASALRVDGAPHIRGHVLAPWTSLLPLGPGLEGLPEQPLQNKTFKTDSKRSSNIKNASDGNVRAPLKINFYTLK